MTEWIWSKEPASNLVHASSEAFIWVVTTPYPIAESLEAVSVSFPSEPPPLTTSLLREICEDSIWSRITEQVIRRSLTNPFLWIHCLLWIFSIASTFLFLGESDLNLFSFILMVPSGFFVSSAIKSIDWRAPPVCLSVSLIRMLKYKLGVPL